MMFSIITINRNNRDGLRRTMESVVGQTYRDYEYIIIDGASTDGSVEIIKEHESHLSYWVSEPDNGIYNAMNKGIAKARGEYCLFMNSGDCLYDNHVLERITTIGHDHPDIIVGKVYSSKSHKELFVPPHGDLSLYCLYSATIAHQGAFIKLDLQRKHPYDEGLKIVSDWKFFVEAIVMDNCRVEFADVPVCLFDTEGVSTSNPKRMWEEKESVLKQLFPERVLKDMARLKASECLTQTLTPRLRKAYTVDRLVYRFASLLLKFTHH